MEILARILVLSVFFLIFWMALCLWNLDKRLRTLEKKRVIELGEDIERLKVISLGLPPGTVEMDFNGVRDIEKISLISFVPKPKPQIKEQP